eukprot:9770012-Alexandrium_andersonii.AAC.1
MMHRLRCCEQTRPVTICTVRLRAISPAPLREGTRPGMRCSCLLKRVRGAWSTPGVEHTTVLETVRSCSQ